MTCKPTLVIRAAASRSAAIVQPPTQKKQMPSLREQAKPHPRKTDICCHSSRQRPAKKLRECFNHMVHTTKYSSQAAQHPKTSISRCPLATPPEPAPKRKCQLAPSSQLGLQPRKPSEIYSPGGGHSKNCQKPIQKSQKLE